MQYSLPNQWRFPNGAPHNRLPKVIPHPHLTPPTKKSWQPFTEVMSRWTVVSRGKVIRGQATLSILVFAHASNWQRSTWVQQADNGWTVRLGPDTPQRGKHTPSCWVQFVFVWILSHSSTKNKTVRYLFTCILQTPKQVCLVRLLNASDPNRTRATCPAPRLSVNITETITYTYTPMITIPI